MIDLIAYAADLPTIETWIVARGLRSQNEEGIGRTETPFEYTLYGSGKFYSVPPETDSDGNITNVPVQIPGVFVCLRFPDSLSIQGYVALNGTSSSVADDLSGVLVDAVTLIKPSDFEQYLAERSQPPHTWLGGSQWSDPSLWTRQIWNTGDQVQWNKKTWESLIDNNVWQPPVGWREVTIEGPPAWIQPTGAADYYRLGEEVTHNGSTWTNTLPVNVFEPGVTGWQNNSPQVQPWSQGGGSGVAGSYNINDEVTHDNPNDAGSIWLYRSKIPANTTEPGRDGTFNRWWEPVRAI